MLLKFRWHMFAPTPAQSSFMDWWLGARKLVRKARRKCFDNMVALVMWKV
jgi:hypothetical protein